VVFIEGPPIPESKAEHVLKYLARYITGGPIAISRLIANEDGQVSFWARSKDKTKKCLNCKYEMDLVSSTYRLSWRELFCGKDQPKWWQIEGSG